MANFDFGWQLRVIQVGLLVVAIALTVIFFGLLSVLRKMTEAQKRFNAVRKCRESFEARMNGKTESSDTQ